MQTPGWAPAPIDSGYRDLSDYVQVVKGRWKLIDLGESPRQLAARLNVTVPKDADVLQARFSHTNPTVAAQGAQAFATSYLDYTRQQAQTLIDQRIATINDNIASLEASGGSRTAISNLNLQIAELQSTPIDPGQPAANGKAGVWEQLRRDRSAG